MRSVSSGFADTEQAWETAADAATHLADAAKISDMNSPTVRTLAHEKMKKQ